MMSHKYLGAMLFWVLKTSKSVLNVILCCTCREPVEGLENGRYVVAASSPCQKARGAVLNALKTLNLAAGGSEVEGVKDAALR